MGYMCFHTIVVTSIYDDYPGAADRRYDIRTAHKEAMRIFGGKLVSPIINSIANHYGSFFIAPDGSKEGWAPSDENDNQREEFVAWLDSMRHVDGSSSFRWAEIQFADEAGDNRILRHSDQPLKNALERLAEESSRQDHQHKG